MHNVWFVASAWMGIAFLASLISIRLGVSVALIEILLGVLAGVCRQNLLDKLAIDLREDLVHLS
jgi:NhaP-type Na+/H+ and K+/H+ antiporter